MADVSDPISAEEKRQAMQRVLESRALRRSEQLRAFLRYVCEAELEGRAEEVNEYALGVFALGRPQDYSPAEDSCVRSRAYELRNKLRGYYETEAPDEPVHILIDKGGYVPRFVRAPAPRVEVQQPGPTENGSSDSRLNTLWEPFFASKAPVLIVFEVRLFFFAPETGLVVRDYEINDLADVVLSKPLGNFQERMGTEELSKTLDYADFGSVHAAFLLGRLFAARSDIGIKHSSTVDWQDIWNSNVVFMGKPNRNAVVRSLLEDTNFVPQDSGVILNTRPTDGEQQQYLNASTHGTGEKHALITRVRGPQLGRYVMLLTGAGAELMWALGECVTNPEQVATLMSHLRTPEGGYPESFQIVIRATFQSNVPIKIEYVTHRVLS